MRVVCYGPSAASALGHYGVDMLWRFFIRCFGPAGRSAEVTCRLTVVLELFTSRMHAWSFDIEFGI